MDERSIAMDLKRNAVQNKLREWTEINVHRLKTKRRPMEFVNVSESQSKYIERSKMVCESRNPCESEAQFD